MLIASEKKELALAVGALCRKSVRHGIASARGDVQSKPSEIAGDLVTDTDLRIQEALECGLRDLAPELEFIGEEGFEARDRLSDTAHWIVDPLDGTLNFASGLPFFGASVALVEKGEPVLGVVYDYGEDAIYDAILDGRSRINGVEFKWNEAAATRGPVGISSGFLARMTEGTEGARFQPEWLGSRFRIFGSQAIQLCWAAAGRLRLNINVEAKLWDDAAGALICKEAGAGYAALQASPLFPLTANSPALAGESLFSVSGSANLVLRCQQDFVEG